MLLHHASDDISSAPQLRRAVEDLSNIRDSKMRKWMQGNVRERVNAIKVNHLSSHEVNGHRPILTKVLDNLYKINVSNDESTIPSETNPTSSSVEPETRPTQGRQLRRVIRRNEIR